MSWLNKFPQSKYLKSYWDKERCLLVSSGHQVIYFANFLKPQIASNKISPVVESINMHTVLLF